MPYQAPHSSQPLQDSHPQSKPNPHLHIHKPHWLKTKITGGSEFFEVKRNLRARQLVTVCEEAKCPNIGQCWNDRTATFMVLGDTCTRACRFCHIKTGHPGQQIPTHEPEHVASSAHAMGLKYVVLTMVDRDDLPDGGASHVADVIRALINKNPLIQVELLAGDFCGDLEATQMLCSLPITVYSHNIETVKRLSPRVRDRRANYNTSLRILEHAHKQKPHKSSELLTKSALMLGLGEQDDEVIATMKDLREVGCNIITIGQYMRPSKKHFSIKRWVKPDEFKRYEQIAKKIGFDAVMSKPLARSSYMAGKLYASAVQSASLQSHDSITTFDQQLS